MKQGESNRLLAQRTVPDSTSLYGTPMEQKMNSQKNDGVFDKRKKKEERLDEVYKRLVKDPRYRAAKTERERVNAMEIFMTKEPGYSTEGKETAEIPADLSDESTFKSVVSYQFFYSLFGLILSLFCIIGAIVLFIHGITGSTSWTASVLGLETELNDAAPGTVLFIVGLCLAWITRFNIKLVKTKDQDKPSE